MKKMVVCCDGTWNEPEEERDGRSVPTNVLKMARAVLPNDGATPQVVYYDTGVGTGGRLDKFVGGATGMGISANIREAYRFLAYNYAGRSDDGTGDQIWLFGFSRGAYSVRSLGGLVATMGLLPKGQMHHLKLVYDYYRTPPADRPLLPAADRDQVEGLIELTRKSARRPRVTFVGVFDTVGALGVPTLALGAVSRRYWVGFHDTALRNVDYAYHALAVDERRKPFTPSVWTKSRDCLEMKQVWFPGAHSNVGGGYKDTGLSDGAFRWMTSMAERRGLAIDGEYLRERTRPDPLDRLADSLSTVYRIGGQTYVRPVGGNHRDVDGERPAVNEYLHQSILDRLNSGHAGLRDAVTFNEVHLRNGAGSLPVEPYTW